MNADDEAILQRIRDLGYPVDAEGGDLFVRNMFRVLGDGPDGRGKIVDITWDIMRERANIEPHAGLSVEDCVSTWAGPPPSDAVIQQIRDGNVMAIREALNR